jgi:hypothetical protein
MSSGQECDKKLIDDLLLSDDGTGNFFSESPTGFAEFSQSSCVSGHVHVHRREE